MRILLLGARGLLGSDLVSTAPADVRVFATDRDDLDVTNSAAVSAALESVQPHVVVNASGYTAVDQAESEPAAAFALNCTAVASLAHLCAERRTRVVHYSTDYVFDGSAQRAYREDDVVRPLGIYGSSKLAGERALLSSGAHALLIRSQWLFGQHGKCFPRTMWERAKRKQSTRVVDDQHGKPTFTVDLARVTWQLVQMGATGVFHAANRGEATWYDVAARVFGAAGASELLTRCTTSEYRSAARRPAHSVLDTGKVEQVLGYPIRAWTAALDELLEKLEAEATPRVQTEA